MKYLAKQNADAESSNFESQIIKKCVKIIMASTDPRETGTIQKQYHLILPCIPLLYHAGL